MKRKRVSAIGTVFLLGLLAIPSGCVNRGDFPRATGTQVELSRDNYRVVKSNVIGESTGFYFLGVIPILPPRRTAALTDLYSHTGLSAGKAEALINVAQERSTLYLILFSLPKLTVRADIIEFTE